MKFDPQDGDISWCSQSFADLYKVRNLFRKLVNVSRFPPDTPVGHDAVEKDVHAAQRVADDGGHLGWVAGHEGYGPGEAEEEGEEDRVPHGLGQLLHGCVSEVGIRLRKIRQEIFFSIGFALLGT